MNNSNMQEINLSLVIPCFNEEEAIPFFYENAIESFANESLIIEFIFVDDGSKDNTLDALKQLNSRDDRVHYLSFSRNFGKESAILAGLKASEGEYVAILDVDGQDPPSLIPKMLEAVASGEYDCAGTRRVTRAGEPPIRSFFAKRFYATMKKITDIEIVDGARDFRLMNRKYLNAFVELTERNRFSKGMFPWIGFKVKWFEYENIERVAGSTKWSFWKLFMYSLDGIFAFSTKPLIIASVMGVLLFFASIVFIVFIVVRRLFWGDPVDGWASTVCIILFCSGIQLFSVGILGQYISKIYTETKQRPQYIIMDSQ